MIADGAVQDEHTLTRTTAGALGLANHFLPFTIAEPDRRDLLPRRQLIELFQL